MKKILLISLVLLVAVLASGCASYTVKSMPSQLDESKVVKVEKEDVSITAFPILTEEDSKRYFDANLPGNNILAIYVNILNTSPNIIEIIASNLIVSRQPIEPLPIKKAYKAIRRGYAGKSIFWWFFGVYVGAPISALHTASVNKDIEQDLNGKILNLANISPKTSRYGFLWFEIPKGVMRDDKFPSSEFVISVKKKDGKIIKYVLPIQSQ